MTTMTIRGVSLFVKVIGHGYPLVLMHGGPSLDHTTLLSQGPVKVILGVIARSIPSPA
jgi:hypothetical protein